MKSPTPTTPDLTRKPPSLGAVMWSNRALLLMMLPCALYYLLFDYIPMGGLMIAFKDYRIDQGIIASPWVGLEHFRTLFSGEEFGQVLRNTLVLSMLKMSFGFVAPIVFALLLNEMRIALLARGVQTLSLLPHLLSWVILAGIFRLIFATGGPVNELAALIGVDKPINWLTDDNWFIAVLVYTEVWKGMGFGAIIYLATISGISPDLYEAARMDGANRWQLIRFVTLPQLKPTIITLLILSLGSFLSAGFDQVYNMYNPLVYDVSDIIDTYVLRLMQSLQFEVATAAGMFKAVIGFLLIVGVNTIVKRMSKGEQGIF